MLQGTHRTVMIRHHKAAFADERCATAAQADHRAQRMRVQIHQRLWVELQPQRSHPVRDVGELLGKPHAFVGLSDGSGEGEGKEAGESAHGSKNVEAVTLGSPAS